MHEKKSTSPPQRQGDPGKARMEGFPSPSDAKLSTGSVERLPHAWIPARRVELMFESKKASRPKTETRDDTPIRSEGWKTARTVRTANHGTPAAKTAHDGVGVIVPLRKWRSADPSILIGRRCIIRHDSNDRSNSMAEGIRNLTIHTGE